MGTLEDSDPGKKVSDGTAGLLGLASNKHDCAEPWKERKKRGNSQIPVCRSSRLAERMRLLSPMYHGMMFHVTVRFLGIFASAFTSKKFFAVSSGLLRETKPVSTALGPGASSKYKISASIPPSHGSKLGMLTCGPTWAQSVSTSAVSGAMCDVVITGEGSLDRQTLEGKTPAGVARLARKLGKRVFAVVGRASENRQAREIFDEVYILARPGMSEKEQMARTAELLRERGRELGRKM